MRTEKTYADRPGQFKDGNALELCTENGYNCPLVPAEVRFMPLSRRQHGFESRWGQHHSNLVSSRSTAPRSEPDDLVSAVARAASVRV